MKIKKNELRKGLAQLPINYPDPDVLAEALPGGAIDLETESVQVELLCKRLAHNEVVVRDEVLKKLPGYLARLTEQMSRMEASYVDEVVRVQDYFDEHPKAVNSYHYNNIPYALQKFREKAQRQARVERRRDAVESLYRQREKDRIKKESQGKFGDNASSVVASTDCDDDDAAASSSGFIRWMSTMVDIRPSVNDGGTFQQRYHTWMRAWCDLELIFLKLCRGIFFCLWHSDKPLVQLACAQRIAHLLHAPLTLRCKNLFYGALFRVLSREWPTIDRYRVDKYLALVRKMIFEWFSFVGKLEEEEEAAVALDCVSQQEGKREGPLLIDMTTPMWKPEARATRCKKRSRAIESFVHGGKGPKRIDEDTSSPPALDVHDIAHQYLERFYANHPVLSRGLGEIFYIFQQQVFPSTTSIGLTMHICDVVFDELTRACLSTNMFVVLAAGIPLYAMSQGNYVEKRVLDNFFPPLAAGVFRKRRTHQLLEKKQKSTTIGKDASEETRGEVKISPELRCAKGGVIADPKTSAAHDNVVILEELAQCCQLYAVARGTVRAVRVMFSEAELVLQQAANPGAYKGLSSSAQHRRLEKEIAEVDETRERVRMERLAVRQLKRVEKKALLIKKSKLHRKTMKDADHVNGKKLVKEILPEMRSIVKKKVPRDTKRKKNYQLTKHDLYDDCDGGKEDI